MDATASASGQSASYPHSVKFYSDENVLGTPSAEFLAPGLRERWPAIVVATPEHIALIYGNSTAAVEPASARVLDADGVLARFMIGPRPDPVRFHQTVDAIIHRACRGRPRCAVRAYGEMVGVLWKRANPSGAIELEMLWNRVATHAQFSLLCGYAVGNFYKEVAGGPTMRTICDEHNHVIPDERAS